jgi:hypothetical protein
VRDLQSVRGLIQRAIEAERISTISISFNRGITGKVKPPRALLVDFPLGHPTGTHRIMAAKENIG